MARAALSVMKAHRRPLRTARQRSVWAVADQILSSISNLLLGTVVARTVTADEYGAFAVGFASMAIALGISRGLSSDAFLARLKVGERERWAREASDAVSFVIAFGMVCSALVGAGGVLAGPTLRPVLWAFAAILTLVLVQDVYRYVLIGGGQANLATLSDGALIAFLLVALALFGGQLDSAPRLVVAWGVSAGLAALVGAAALRQAPTVRGVGAWWHRTRRLGARFATEFVLLSGSSQIVLFALAVTSGLVAAAALRGANVILGPAAIVTTGLVAAAIPEGRRLLVRGDKRFRTLIIVLAAGLSAMTIAWGLVAYWLPIGVGRFLLGDTWLSARSIMPLLGLAAGGTAASTGLMAGLRALQAASGSLRATVPLALLATAGGVVGGHFGGATGAVIGLTGPLWVGVVLYWRAFRRALEAYV